MPGCSTDLTWWYVASGEPLLRDRVVSALSAIRQDRESGDAQTKFFRLMYGLNSVLPDSAIGPIKDKWFEVTAGMTNGRRSIAWPGLPKFPIS